MLHLDDNHANTSFRSLLAFKPRQVLIAQHNSRTTMTASASKDENSTKIALGAPEMKGTLHEIILDYFHRNGFSKTLKRFQSEAQIQTDAWKVSSLHLEDLFCKHNACDADSNKNTINKPGNDEAMEKEKVYPSNEETITKKKKKKVIVETDDCAIKAQSEVIDKKIKESSKNFGQISKDIIVGELETKSKKKKTKHDFVSSTDDAINGLKIDDLTKKIKDKKNKNIEEVKLEPSTTNEKELVPEVAEKEKKKKKNLSTDENGIIEAIQPYVTKKEKKSSKKRKRSFSDENENGSTEMTNTKESKNQKTEIDRAKSKKKQRNVTAEPKTVNAFQRVKLDEVEFAHDNLQDNSYWAKDGAEIGYGAKAQEVLGQVRGRDFRHEKTKKKRGSYRGGLIDQESHSIKFAYSDEG